MEVKGYSIPEGFFYTREHEWAKEEGEAIRIGVTDYAAKTLNDVVYVTPPKVGEQIEHAKPMGTVESIKAVSEIFAPISGTVTKVNTALDSHPELVNQSPHGDGWLVEVRPTAFESEKGLLLDAGGYAEYLASLLK